MSGMNDDDLRASLTRRASDQLTPQQRSDILRAARLQASAPQRRVFPRLAGYLVAVAAVIVLVLVALPILLSPPSPVAPPPPTLPPSPPPTLHVSNDTTLLLTVSINDQVVGSAPPGQISNFDPTSFAGPWHVAIDTASGRRLLDMTYSAGEISSTNGSEGGVGQRLDLSCGRLDVYAGPPMSGPAPPQSFPPNDCQP